MRWVSFITDIIDGETGLRQRERAIGKLRSDIALLESFIGVYCRAKHACAPREPIRLKGCDLHEAGGREAVLCAECGKLLQHAVVKRATCTMDPKPTCRRCPSHCYAPRYREMIRRVMAYAGRRAVLRGRLDYLLHLLP